MTKHLLIVFLSVISSLTLSAQERILLLDQEITILSKGLVEYHFGFAKGDQFEMRLSSIDNKRISSATIQLLDESRQWDEIGFKQFNLKSPTIENEVVVSFQVYNSKRSDRRVKIKIDRLPASGMEAYNSQVVWQTLSDTIWEQVEVTDTIAYDTLRLEKTEPVLDSLYRYEMELMSETFNVPSRSTHQSTKKNLMRVPIIFPEFDNTDLKQRRLVSWAFAIAGVPIGIEKNINPVLILKDSSQLVKKHFRGELTELGALALNLTQVVQLPISDRQYRYYLMKAFQAQSFMYYGYAKYILGNTATAGFHRFDNDQDQWNEIHYLAVDNINQNFDVNVKAAARGIVEVKTYKENTHMVTELTPITETRMLKKPLIKTRKIPIAIGLQ